MFIGRILGTVIGYFAFGALGFVGAIIGYGIGSIFDAGLKRTQARFSPEQRAKVEQAFFVTVFPLMGRLAKSDGHISAEEISGTEQLMNKMGLAADKRKEAIELFKQGADASYEIDPLLDAFAEQCGGFNDLKQIFIVYLITLAYADGTLHPAEEELLLHVADKVGYNRFTFNRLLGMVKAQTHFYRGQQEQTGYRSGGYQGGRTNSSADELEMAYKALGVESSISDTELKKAYRRLMSEYHPDKLAGRGVPDDMVKLATERSQEVQAAYDMVKKARK